jgi:hypothetical protein
MRGLFAVSVFAAGAALAGCGGSTPPLVPVTGKVTHKGKALTGGSVWLHPEGATGDQKEKTSGQLQLDGTFSCRTFPHGDGATPGKYKVTLSPDLAGRIGAPAYGTTTKTPWELTVPDSGVKDHTFEVK